LRAHRPQSMGMPWDPWAAMKAAPSQLRCWLLLRWRWSVAKRGWLPPPPPLTPPLLLLLLTSGRGRGKPPPWPSPLPGVALICTSAASAAAATSSSHCRTRFLAALRAPELASRRTATGTLTGTPPSSSPSSPPILAALLPGQLPRLPRVSLAEASHVALTEIWNHCARH